MKGILEELVAVRSIGVVATRCQRIFEFRLRDSTEIELRPSPPLEGGGAFRSCGVAHVALSWCGLQWLMP
jgi:hypothetical protein